MDLSFALARRLKADLVLANDPDADRLAIALPARKAGEGSGYVQLTGNQVGVLLGHYILTEGSTEKTPRRVVLASLVSSPMLGAIARELGVHYEETLTGFKWMASRAIALERQGYDVVFAYEEALGYCVGSAVRDKDGISAALLAAEVTAVLRERGQTVGDALDAIARRWGVFTSAQVSLTRAGTGGAAAIASMIDALRAAPPDALDGDAVVAVADYEAGVRTVRGPGGPAPATGAQAVSQPGVALTTTPLTLPRSNVLVLELASGSRVVARPSGTEPKAKFYFDVRAAVAPGEPVSAARGRALAVQKRLAAAFAYHAGSAAAAARDERGNRAP
jgi:phosphomannomutase